MVRSAGDPNVTVEQRLVPGHQSDLFKSRGRGQTRYPAGVASVTPINNNHSNNVLWSYGSTRIHAETRTLSCLPQKGGNSNPSLLRVRIKGSKTDPFREGANIFLRRAHNKLCQVETMLAYLAIRGSAPGFLFKFADGHFLTKERFTKEVREALLAKGVKAELYAGHSIRAASTWSCSEHLWVLQGMSCSEYSLSYESTCET